MRYDAFVSYSRENGDLAAALQDALQRFSKPWYRRSPFIKVFRDATSLGAGHDLGDKIEAAIDECAHLVLVLSPASVDSPWVDTEVAHFLATKGAENITVVVQGWREDDGKPALGNLATYDWVGADVPASLRGEFDEPLAVDMRWTATATRLSLDDDQFRDDVATIAASIRGQSKDELIGAVVAMRTRARILTSSVLLGALILLGAIAISVPGWLQARASQRTAETAVAEAEATLTELNAELASTSDLLAAADRDLGDARALLDDANIGLATAEATLADVRSNLTSTEGQRDAAEAERDRAATGRDEAVQARDEAATARDVAAAARDEAVTAQETAQAARSVAEQARDSAQAAQDEAEDARSDAERARDSAQAAQDEAEDARDSAEDARDVAADEADRQLTIADARRLSGLAQSNLESDLSLASLLAVESVNRSTATSQRSSFGSAQGSLVASPVASRDASPAALVAAAPTYEARNALLQSVQARPALLATLYSGKQRMSDVASSADGTVLAGVSNTQLHFWDGLTLQPTSRIDIGSLDSPHLVALQPSGDRVAVSARTTVTIFEVDTGQLVTTLDLPEFTGAVDAMEFSPDGSRLAAAALDTVCCLKLPIRIWDVATETSIDLKIEQRVLELAFSPDGKQFVAIDGGRLRIWDLSAPEQTAYERSSEIVADADAGREAGSLSAVAFTSDGASLLVGGAQSELLRFETTGYTSSAFPLFWVSSSDINDVAISADGTRFVVSVEGALLSWQTQSLDAEAVRIDVGVDEVFSHLLADGRAVTFGGFGDGTIRIWETKNDQPLGERGDDISDAGVGGSVNDCNVLFPADVLDCTLATSVAVSSDGTTVFAGLGDLVKAYEIPGFRARGEFIGPEGLRAVSVSVSSDGTMLAAAFEGLGFTGDGGAVFLWDVESQSPLGEPLTAHDGQFGFGVSGVEFSASGTTLVSTGVRPSKRTWDLSVSGLVERACSRANRNLTQTEWARLRPGVEYRRTCPQFLDGT